MIKRIFLIFILFIFISVAATPHTFADELEEIEKKLSDLKSALEMSKSATKPLESNLARLQANLEDLQKRIVSVEQEIVKKEKEVKEGEDSLAVQQKILEERIRSFYKNSRQTQNYSLHLFTSRIDLGEILRLTAYRKSVIDEDKRVITEIVLYVKALEEKKSKLESEKTRLAKVKEETDRQADFLKKEITGAKQYQSVLSSQIAQLSARQQELIAQKLASLNLPTSLGAGPLYCTDDRNLEPGFRPAFAFFTYGIPHRVGMNQYGAYGRAKARQNYQDILKAYFNGVNFEGGKENITIKIQGHGEKPLDEYLLGIYEMPENWPMEALKAQAVAARSYALAYTNNGQGEICTTQACQVWKPEKKTGQWKEAVEQTKGQVMTYNGEIVKAWYASTFGGFSFTSGDVWGSNKGWTKRMRDTDGDINSFGELQDKAYDKDSPCFYAAQGWRNEYAKSAWLKSEEVADIVNVLMLAKRDSGARSHLYQTDKPNPEGTDTWDANKVKQELRNRGGLPYNNVSGVSVDWDKGSGQTTAVWVSGDAGENSFDGTEFRNYFNLRAPSNIQIVGPLYNIEKK